MKKFIKNPYNLELLALSSISILVSLENINNFLRFPYLLILIALSLLTEFVLMELFNITDKVDVRNITSAFYIFLIAGKQTNIFILLFAVILVILFLHILHYRQKPIFNPFTLSLLISSLFGLKITWWGILGDPRIIVIMLFFGVIMNYFNKTLRIALLYLLLIVSFSFILTVNSLYSIKLVLIPGLLFFSFYLLSKNIPEPTRNNMSAYIYIVSASFLSVTLPKFGFFTDPLITALVLTDIITLAIVLFDMKSRPMISEA